MNIKNQNISSSLIDTMLDTTRERILKMIRQYHKALTERNIRHSKAYIKSLDCIDISQLIPENNNDMKWADISKLQKTVLNYENTDDFFLYVPCFEEGTFKIRHNEYLYFHINTLLLAGGNSKANINGEQIEERTPDIINTNYCEIQLEKYIFMSEMKWTPGTKMKIVVRKKPNETTEIADMFLETTSDMYRLLSSEELKELDWSEKDIDLWQTFITENIAHMELDKDKLVSKTIQEYSICMAYTNICLQTKKLSHGKRTGSKKSVKTEIEKSAEQPKKLTRRISVDSGIGSKAISITSDKIPKTASEEHVIHYSVAQWKTRGHIRRYKNGKTTWIKETIHKRKGFEKTDTIPQSVIQLTKK